MAEDKVKDAAPAVAPAQSLSDYDPRADLGPERPEDKLDLTPSGFKPAKVDSEEVPLEKQRKDETTLLATDTVRVNDEGIAEIV